jgi:ribosomal-protein-alanine N-acetyltransferase
VASGFLPLDTPRLALVALTLEHAQAIFQFAADPHVSAPVAWQQHTTLDDSREFIARSMIGRARGEHYQWGVLRRADHTLIGTCDLGALDAEHGVAELGYALGRAHWGRGYATEAAAAVLAFGFQTLTLRAIEAETFPDNRASQRVLIKLGLRCLGLRERIEDDVARAVQAWRLEREPWGAGRMEGCQ